MPESADLWSVLLVRGDSTLKHGDDGRMAQAALVSLVGEPMPMAGVSPGIEPLIAM